MNQAATQKTAHLDVNLAGRKDDGGGVIFRMVGRGQKFWFNKTHRPRRVRHQTKALTAQDTQPPQKTVHRHLIKRDICWGLWVLHIP